MEPPLRVTAVGPRVRLLYILAYWADRELQHREWILRERRELFVNALSIQVGFFYDAIDVPPPLEDAVGGIIASIDEVRRLEALDARLCRLWAVKAVDDDRPETSFDLPEWHDVSTPAQNVVNLFLMNGGAWDDSEPTVIDDDHLVAEFPIRGLAAQCLASIAGDDHYRAAAPATGPVTSQGSRNEISHQGLGRQSRQRLVFVDRHRHRKRVDHCAGEPP